MIWHHASLASWPKMDQQFLCLHCQCSYRILLVTTSHHLCQWLQFMENEEDVLAPSSSSTHGLQSWRKSLRWAGWTEICWGMEQMRGARRYLFEPQHSPGYRGRRWAWPQSLCASTLLQAKAVKLGLLRIQFASHILLDNFQRVHKIGHGCREIIRRPGGLGELPQTFSIIDLPIIGHEDWNLIPLLVLLVPTNTLLPHSIHIFSSNDAWMIRMNAVNCSDILIPYCSFPGLTNRLMVSFFLRMAES